MSYHVKDNRGSAPFEMQVESYVGNTVIKETVKASLMVIEGGAYVFYGEQINFICSYPVDRTIVKK